MPQTFAYLRFSHLDQAEGTSIKRQDEDCSRYAAQRGWHIDQRLVDRGKSAFSGANRDRGAALGTFEAEAASGLHAGAILIVERIDRISRQGFDEVRDFIRSLNGAGVTLAVAEGDVIYEPGEKLDTGKLLTLVIKAELAREESEKKSQRLKRKYEIRRAEAKESGKALTANLPAWLCKGADGKPAVIRGRDLLLKRVFDLADGGAGSLRITRVLNAEFEPWQGRNGQPSRFWTRSRIDRLLRDRQVTGEYQPMTRVDGKLVPAGAAWPAYFPLVISVEQFERVAAAAKVRQSPVCKRSTTVGNLFGGLLRCRHCGGPMLFERKRVAGRSYHRGRYTLLHDEAQVRCSAAWYDRGSDTARCANLATVSYYGFERAMLDAALHLALDDRTFVQADELGRINANLAEKRRARDLAYDEAKALWLAYARQPSSNLEAIARDADARVGALDLDISLLETKAAAAAGQADAEAHLSRIADFRRFLYDDDLDVRARHRTKAAQGFRSIIERIDFDDQRQAVVHLIAGVRQITILRGKVTRDFDFVRYDRGRIFSDEQRAVGEAYLRRAVAGRAA